MSSINEIVNYTRSLKSALIGLSAITLLSACNDSNTPPPPGATQAPSDTQTARAIVSTVATDYSSGAMSVISLTKPRTVENDILPTISDITVVADGDDFYRIERFNADNITKFNLSSPSTPLWQYSTMDAGTSGSSNPHSIVVASDDKAYVLRYGSESLWIVNPSATNQADFKIGEIDLSAYDPADGIPNMSQGIIIGDKLFVTTAALDANWVPQQAHLVVIDINTDTEVDTGLSSDPNIKGIPLPVRGPGQLDYAATSNKIYLQAAGRIGFPAWGIKGEYDGGILTIDPSTFAVNMLIDDGDATTQPYGNITKLAISSADKGYFVGYDENTDLDSLYSFNPTTGTVNATPVADVFGKDIADIAIAPTGNLWVASRSDFGIIVIDPSTDTAETSLISTGSLPPDTIVFSDF